jgi:hypothetical protein
MNYHDLTKFYKGLIVEDSLTTSTEGNPASDAIKYGLANWYYYNGYKRESQIMLNEIVSGKSWNSFGFIAAESDLIEYFEYPKTKPPK